jgi:hypothetical protein
MPTDGLRVFSRPSEAHLAQETSVNTEYLPKTTANNVDSSETGREATEDAGGWPEMIGA